MEIRIQFGFFFLFPRTRKDFSAKILPDKSRGKSAQVTDLPSFRLKNADVIKILINFHFQFLKKKKFWSDFGQKNEIVSFFF